jgi:pimeloyl-ACP methyl ester carboxylesterase
VRRAAFGLGALFAFAFAVLPVALGYVTTHVARAVVPADRLGVPHETVTFESTDGLKLEGWYIPSRNGAAVIVFPGRRGPQEQARMLAKHGYGVLLFDRRGEGRSEGRPNAFGWGGDRDIKGAIEFLKTRGIDRIGGLGLSVGGELMLETAAETGELDAVVSEGAGARVTGEALDDPALPGRDRPLAALQNGFKDLAMAVSANALPPKHLKTLVEQIDQPTLLIAAPNTHNGEKLNRVYAEGTTATLWEIPESKHVQGIKARPAEYEQRVVGFFDRAL